MVVVHSDHERGATVRLSSGNWASLLSTIIGTGVAQALLLYGRLIALETTVEQHDKALDTQARQIEQTRQEFVGEIRSLRVELKTGQGT